MISGLLASTVLTLVVVPALYRLLFAPTRRRKAIVTRAATQSAALLVLLITSVPALAEETLRLTVRDSMARARQRPAAEAATLAARATEQVGLAERRLSYLPTFTTAGSLSQRDRDLDLLTPIGSFPFGDSRTDSAAVRLTQPLLDPPGLFHAAPATRAEAAAARLGAERTHQQLAAAAALLHLDTLGVDARLATTGAYIDSLGARRTEMQEMVAAGRALEADALKVSLALDQAEQDRLALEQARAVLVAALARAIGHDGELEPMPAPDLLLLGPPLLEELVDRAMSQRSDAGALSASVEALERRRAAVRAELLPRLDASATWTWSNGSPYSADNWTEAALTVTWTPLASGTRGPRAAALAAQRDAAHADLEELHRAIRVEIRTALAGLETARGAFDVGTRGVEQARETLRVERERHLAGRATTNDLLEAEAVLRDRRTTRELARLDVVRAWIELWLALGEGELPEGV
jgi:outer membrane protein TolC